jgi:hypothetical protein
MTVYKYTTLVEECTERTTVVSAHKDPDGEVHFERLSTGWWLTLRNDLGGHITWPLGRDAPDPGFTPGQKVIVTIALSDSQ